MELAVVVGRTAICLPDESAANRCIAGYAISNDLSERHYQLERSGQWVKGKSWDTFNPFGPWLVTAEEIPDPQSLALELRVNNTVMQKSSTTKMLFPVSHIVWYLSQFMTLHPGDIINTGTPVGVGMGMTPPQYLKPGDVIDLSIQSLGAQSQTVRSFSPDPPPEEA